MSGSEVLLQLSDVSVSVAKKTILSHVNLSVHREEIVTLIGPNGAGKTSLVRVVLGLMPFTGQRTLKPQLRIGYMPQKLSLNTQLPISVKRFLQTSAAKPSQIQHWLNILDIVNLSTQPMQKISGGELQRVLLARALLQNPDLLVLDEPVQGVDINGQAELYQLIQKIKSQQHCGVLMVSHDLHVVMAKTDQVVCLNQHICCHGHPEAVSHHPAFHELFGENAAESMAVYTHHHDHEHDLHGNVIDSKPHQHNHNH